jgi:site-specific DNA recombinase
MSSSDRKRAAILLRVSSAGQVRTDYDPEGLSIPAQRQACERKATQQLDADVVREYVEPGVSGGSLVKRKTFQKMIADIRELRDIDYVIVWSVSRWARDQEDHWTARGLINRAGAKLISVKEPIGDDTAYGVTMEGVMAAVAAGRRIEISEEVTRGIQRKVEVGGKPGLAPLGYLNVREPLPQGGEIRTIVIDPERAPLIRWAYETYATGFYSTNDMIALLAARGLLSRGNRRYAPRPLNHSSVYELLSNPFYAGKVVFKGKKYPGRHEKLVSEELFDRVQAVLKSHCLSGERDRKHQHYLKGTVRCGFCDHRLTYSRNTGNGGTYDYFVCPLNQRGHCPLSYRRVDEAEAKIEECYKTLAFTDDERREVTSMVEHNLAEIATTSEQELNNCNMVLAELKEEERKLIGKHYKDEISEELFSEESARIKRKRQDTEAITARLLADYTELKKYLSMAFRLTQADLYDLYLCATPRNRRLINQGTLKGVWLSDDEEHEDTRVEFASPIDKILAIRQAGSRATETPETHAERAAYFPVRMAATDAEDDEAPGPWQDSGDIALGSISEVMVGTAGFEPATSRV